MEWKPTAHLTPSVITRNIRAVEAERTQLKGEERETARRYNEELGEQPSDSSATSIPSGVGSRDLGNGSMYAPCACAEHRHLVDNAVGDIASDCIGAYANDCHKKQMDHNRRTALLQRMDAVDLPGHDTASAKVTVNTEVEEHPHA
ncbi:uncharacterized protein MYCGRDRAFT_97999 [Zymoseptoria tritici IPO323]|uniref:Uncharacterized protein n=1 Tax=Zymoseptoria tritici (strain CBS 115943 / IPO323) TaxID=336722 RepID=F9XS09_ZYMTI|nr:uncharacterized protein MYCGRDRAFT_97999 [Zymoseptoria tritici IPO323]EGP81963.1 hypothetical protein MYCGRDRAFT_97999 [Zymoseptoria tritici IPO323]